MLPPLEHLADCNGSLYALQLNVYRYILESEYNCDIGDNMFLGVCHPDLSKPHLIRVPTLQDKIDIIVANLISHGQALTVAEPGSHAQFRLPT